MANIILLVFEGEKTEKQIFDNLKKYYFNKDNENIVFYSSFNTDIYQLYDEMKNDGYLDIFSLLKEKPQNKERLNEITSRNISEVFLFFDYDGHANKASDNKISALLQYFDEETENGKLYISYPMIESLKHLHRNTDFSQVIVKAKENIKYKNMVNNEGEYRYQNLKMLKKEDWSIILNEHSKKMEYIVYNKFIRPKKLISQLKIFKFQLKKYITPRNEISVFNGIPIFIIDYYGINILP